MDIWEIDKLILFIAFVIPGFISIKAYQLFFPGIARNSADQLIDAIAYSSINYALLILPIYWIESSSWKSNCAVLYYFFYIFVFFLAPIIWVWIWKFLRTRDFVQNNIPHPTERPWDYVFSQRKPYWVKVKLKDGTVIAGLYSEKSFASSAPAPEQIYLEEYWLLNDKNGFDRPKKLTEGVIILSSEIVYIELIKYEG